MANQDATHPGYWKDARGNLIPESNVKDVDKLRDELVREQIGKAKKLSEEIARFKGCAMGDIEAFIKLSADKYDAKVGGKKGNVTMFSYDGQYKVIRQVAEHMTFDERLQAAKALIDECLREWTEDGRDEVKTIINDAFQVDQEGKINVGRILGLRRLEITDPRWLKAMQAISDSLQVVGSKPYVRFYERQADDSYTPIPLDIASI
ncbi:MAG: DUF3164 family protein [Pseudodesulfovibrio sp.]|uniref:DUF3164 family protein n=1 Tax=Pseudodesulfovibrio sp. TaxID=2035812 RepID=UPI003D1135B0